MDCPLGNERVWVDKARYHDAERDYFLQLTTLLEKGPPLSDNHKSIVANLIETKKSNTSEMSQIDVAPPPPVAPSSVKGRKNKKAKLSVAAAAAPAVAAVPPPPSTITEDLVKSVKRPISNLEMVEKVQLDGGNAVGEETKIKKKKKKKSSNNSVATAANGANTTIVDKSTESIALESIPIELPPAPEKEKDKKNKSKTKTKGSGSNQCTLVSEIAKARQHIKNSLERIDGIAVLAATPGPADVTERLNTVETEHHSLRDFVNNLSKLYAETAQRITILEEKCASMAVFKIQPQMDMVAAKKPIDDDDDGVDLFGSDSEGESEEAAKIREERLAAYAAKKSKKPVLIAKSSILLDVKPWDDETDLKMMETEIRKIHCDGLLWGASKFMPVAFGIQKLSIGCVVEDEKVSIDWLTEEIEKFDDFVQSVDIAAFNKI